MSEKPSARIETIRCDADSLAGVILTKMVREKVSVVDIRELPGATTTLIRASANRLRNMTANLVLTEVRPYCYELAADVEVELDAYPGVVLAFKNIGDDVFCHPVSHTWKRAEECPRVVKTAPSSVWELAC
jgi:hypothetical protein